MAFWSKGGQSLPLGSAVTQRTLADAGGNIRPLQYNESNSGGSAYVAISTATTTTVLSAPGRLCRVHVPGTGGTLGDVTIYDNTAGSGTAIYGPTSPSAGDVIDLQIPVQTGITVVTAAATTLIVTFEGS